MTIDCFQYLFANCSVLLPYLSALCAPSDVTRLARIVLQRRLKHDSEFAFAINGPRLFNNLTKSVWSADSTVISNN